MHFKKTLLWMVMGIWVGATWYSAAFGAGYSLKVGPASFGLGHPNPITLVSPLEYHFTYVQRSGFEFNASLLGLFAGERSYFKNGMYVSVGGGLAVDYNGVGPGVYAAFGIDIACKSICPTLEYTQVLGISRSLLAPYAVRLGITLWTD